MTPAALVEGAALRLGVEASLVASRARGKGVERVRFAVAWVLRGQPSRLTFSAIGKEIGRTPSTARHAWSRAMQLRIEDFDFRQATDALLDRLQEATR